MKTPFGQVGRVLVCVLALVSLAEAAPLVASRNDTEQDLRSRIDREHDPVKKAKLEIRLAQVMLVRAEEACQKDDHEACHMSLEAYLEQVRNSWKDLQSSGKNAVKQPSGFRDVDIALREQAHEMEDLKHRLPVEDRDVLDPVMKEADKVHTEVFNALFPSGGARPKGGKSAPHFRFQANPGIVR